MGGPVLFVEGLRKSFPGGFRLEIDEISFDAGKVHVITGPNGSGKSTLLRLLALLDKPDGGRVLFHGKAVGTGVNGRLYRCAVGLVPQEPYLFKGSVLSNVLYGLRLRGVARRARERAGMEALERVGLEDLAARRVSGLSGGEKQRVALARTLVLRTEVLLLDEPTAHVDRAMVGRVEELILSAASDRGIPVIMATHSLSLAGRLGDRLVPMMGGKPIRSRMDNFFGGVALEKGQIAIGPGVIVESVTERRGAVHVLVPPDDIVLSRESFESSARNRLRGRISSMSEEGSLVRVTVDAGVPFSVLVTERSFREMGLSLGTELFLTFKSSAVRVY